MELVFRCLSAIECVFLIAHFAASIFFRIDRAVIHWLVTSVVLCGAYVLEGILRLQLYQKDFILAAVLSFCLAFIWGLSILKRISNVKRLNRIKKQMEEDQLK